MYPTEIYGTEKSSLLVMLQSPNGTSSVGCLVRYMSLLLTLRLGEWEEEVRKKKEGTVTFRYTPQNANAHLCGRCSTGRAA